MNRQVPLPASTQPAAAASWRDWDLPDDYGEAHQHRKNDPDDSAGDEPGQG
jgi:hypothetical protein